MARLGPWLVGLGAALWGTESAWRIPLNDLFASDVIVFWEHVILVLAALPILLPHLTSLRRFSGRAWAYLVFSGIAGSAVGTVFFTEALKHGNASVVNVVLNIQPLLSTTFAVILFRDRPARGFYPWAALAIVAGAVLTVEKPELLGTSFVEAGLNSGTGYALLCALMWGLSTVAGRGVMVEMPALLASGLRVVVGLVCLTIILAAQGQLGGALWPAAAQVAPMKTGALLVVLAIVSGGVPLVIYFKGLSLTRASTAGYFEMFQTLAAVAITWGFFGAALRWHQVAAGLVLIFAVAMVQRAQEMGR